MNKEFYKTNTAIASFLVIIGFILPWYSMGIISFSGYDLPKMAELAANISDHFTANHKEEELKLYKLYYLLYLLPTLSIYLLYCEYTQTNKFKVISKLGISLLMLSFIICEIIRIEHITEFIKFLGYGFLISLSGCFYFSFQLIKEFKIDKNLFLKIFNSLKVNLSNKLKINKKPIVISLTIVLVCIALFLFFYKNSYDKVIIAFKNQNWKEVKLNYIKVNSDMADGKLVLNPDERHKIETIYGLTNKLQLIENFKQKFNSVDKKNTDSFLPLNTLWFDLRYTDSDLNDAKKAAIDISQLQKTYFILNDDFKLSFAESMLNNTLYKQLLKEKYNGNEKDLVINKLVSTIDILIEQVHNKKSTTAKQRMSVINKNLFEFKKSRYNMNQDLDNSNFNLEPFLFTGKEGEFDNCFAENKKMFKEKKYVGYLSTFNKRSFIISINNKKEVLQEDESQDEIIYKNKDYSLIIAFLQRLDDSPSEDQGEAMYKLTVKNLHSGEKTIKDVYCYCFFF